jgi:ferredoxin
MARGRWIMRISVDEQVCQGHGLCIGTAPELFRMNEIEHAAVISPDVPDLMAEIAHAAVRQCPEGAISVVSVIAPGATE